MVSLHEEVHHPSSQAVKHCMQRGGDRGMSKSKHRVRRWSWIEKDDSVFWYPVLSVAIIILDVPDLLPVSLGNSRVSGEITRWNSLKVHSWRLPVEKQSCDRSC